MSKHLFIGLGKTGLKMLHALRGVIREEMTLREAVINGKPCTQYVFPEHDLPADVQLAFLEVSCSAAEMPNELPHCEQLIHPMPDADMPTRQEHAWHFARHSTGLEEKVLELCTALGDCHGVQIHLCASLGDAFSSATLADTVCRLRQLFPHEGYHVSSVSIQLYLTLPCKFMLDEHPLVGAHAYAALAELSSLDTRQWTPQNKTPGAEGSPYRLETTPPQDDALYLVFNSAYLMEEDGPDPAQLFAHFLYESVFAWLLISAYEQQQVTTIRRMMQHEAMRYFTYEVSHEYDCEFWEYTHQRIQSCAIHTNRFIQLGLKCLEVPVQEMKRHYAAALAYEFLLHLLFNEARPGGYLDREVLLYTPAKKAEYQKSLEVRTADLRAKLEKDLRLWKLKEDGVITGQEGILPNEDGIKIWDFWEDESYTMQHEIKKNVSMSKSWLIDLEATLESFFDESYFCARDQEPQGVKAYYSMLEEQVEERARAHVAAWEKNILLKSLFSNKGASKEQMSLRDMQLTLRALAQLLTGEGGCIDRCRQRLSWLTDKQNGILRNLEMEAQDIKAEYNKLTFLTRWLHREPLLQEFSYVLCESMIARTEVEARRYELLYLEQLAAELQRSEAAMQQLLHHFDTVLRGEAGIQALLRNSCPAVRDIETSLWANVCTKLYDPATMRRNVERLRSDKELVQTSQSALRAALLRMVSGSKAVDELTLQDLAHNVADLQQVLMQTCLDLIDTNSAFAFVHDFNLNKFIFQRDLPQSWLAEQLIRTELSMPHLIEKELSMFPCSNPPISKHLHCQRSVMLPAEGRECVTTLTKRLEAELGSHGTCLRNSCTRMSMIQMVNGLPPRAFARVRECYEAFLKVDAGAIFVDGADNMPFPQFFPTQEEIGAMYRGELSTDTRYGSLLKRYLLGWVFPFTNPATGASFWCTPLPLPDDTSLPAPSATPEALSQHPLRRLTEKRTGNFLAQDCHRAVEDTMAQVTSTMASEYDTFSMTMLFREMRETQRAWQALCHPPLADAATLAQRQSVLERLHAAQAQLQSSAETTCPTLQEMLTRLEQELG